MANQKTYTAEQVADYLLIYNELFLLMESNPFYMFDSRVSGLYAQIPLEVRSDIVEKRKSLKNKLIPEPSETIRQT